MSNQISKETAEMIFKELSNYVYRIALFLTKSKDLADDITQETFIQVFRKYHTFDSAKPIKPWLNKITVNVTRNILRKQKWLNFFGELPQKSSLDLVDIDNLTNLQQYKYLTIRKNFVK